MACFVSVVVTLMMIRVSAMVEGVSCDTCATRLIENGLCDLFPSTGNFLEEEYLVKYVSSECSNQIDCVSIMEAACYERCNSVEIPECNFDNCCSESPLALCYTMECMGDYHFCCDIWADAGREDATKYSRRRQDSIPVEAPSVDPVQVPSVDPSVWSPSLDPSLDPSVWVEPCEQRYEWTQERSDATCPTKASHAYGVGMCDEYNNPDYTSRLEFGLANNLYSDCNHGCVYDYKTFYKDVHLGFRWTGSCYTVNIGSWYCIEDEVEALTTVHAIIPTICEDVDGDCIERVAWSPEVAEANCPDGYGEGGDKGYGTAKICFESIRLVSGQFEYAHVLYEESFNLTLANHIYWSCSSTCMYDLVHTDWSYYWNDEEKCWTMQTWFTCFTSQTNHYAWALEYIEDEVCYEATPAPQETTCTERETEWTEELAQSTCHNDEMGNTDKGSNAIVCDGYEDYQYRLDLSLANRMFLDCAAWCVYDIFSFSSEAFIWRNGAEEKCYKPVTNGLCIVHDSATREIMEDYVMNILCETHTPEPTHSPTCSQNLEWSEDLMDELCTVEQTRLTYKHHDGVGRAAVPCEGYEDYEADLLKSLALALYSACSSWCVYDYASGGASAWKWNNNDLCWNLVSWGSCHWDYTNDVNNTEWEDAKERISGICTLSPTTAPVPSPTTAPVPTCESNQEWSEDLMDELCTVDQTRLTYKHHDGVGRAPVPCEGYWDYEDDLLKSLAQELYLSCSSWCVYDYASGGVLAWRWNNNDLCWNLESWGRCQWDFENGMNNTEWEAAKEQISYICTLSPTFAPTLACGSYTWDEERAEELCPLNLGYGSTEKSYGVSVCTDANSATKQQALEDSLANDFYEGCTSWCVYDYDTLINNVRTGSTDQGGFKWNAVDNCWKWVTAGTCFTIKFNEYELVVSKAKQCAGE